MTARRILACIVTVSFLAGSLTPVKTYAATTVLGLPAPGTMVNLSPTYVPVLMKGVHVHPENPLLFDFIIDTGHSGLNSDTPQLRQESEKLIKYFLATLAIPEKDLWVNLSPYEKDRMINEQLGQTEMGRDMLAQDYMLKQMTASLIYPEKELGKKFWDKVYAQAQQKFGSVQIPVNTFNKVWIMPDKAGVFVRNNTAYVVEGHLKVMLEEDYLALQKNENVVMPAEAGIHSVASQIVRDIVLPELEKEINTGKNFAPLRQIFYSLVLASWYKKNLKQAFLNQVYSDKAKVNGVNVEDKAIGQKIYQQYLEAYKKGVFNYIKEDVDRLKQQPMPRKYFSGGLGFAHELSATREVKVYATPPAGTDFAMTGGFTVAAAMFKETLRSLKPDLIAADQLMQREVEQHRAFMNEVQSRSGRERTAYFKNQILGIKVDVDSWGNIMQAPAGMKLSEKLWETQRWQLNPAIERKIRRIATRRGLSELQGFMDEKTFAARAVFLGGMTWDELSELFPDSAMMAASSEGERTAETVTAQDFQELVRLREQGQAGFHLNVDPTPVIPAPESAVLDVTKIPAEEQSRLAAEEAQMYRQDKIGEIVMAGGEATRFGGPKTFVEVVKELGDFLQIKVANLRWATKRFGTKVPLYILSSERRLPEFKEALNSRNYYGMDPQTYQWYTQGVVDTFIPTDAEIEANFKGNAEAIERNKKHAQALRAANPDGIYRFNGERRFVPGGHFDAIASFIISGRLTEALKQGIQYVPVFNIDNLQALLKNDGVIAHFAEQGYDFAFILAEKNLTFTVKSRIGEVIGNNIIVRFRDNVVSFDGINEFKEQAERGGLRFVINQKDKKLDVFDTTSGQLIDTEQTVKAETGGTLVQPVGEQGQPAGNPIMKEGFELQPDFPHANAPFFNTNTVLVRLQSLLKFMGVTEEQLANMSFEERSKLVREELVKRIKPNFEFKNHEVDGEYPELGEVRNGKTRISVVQLTRIMLQVAHIPGAKVGYYFAPRASVFAPVKEPQDKVIAATNNLESLKAITDYGTERITGQARETVPQRIFTWDNIQGDTAYWLAQDYSGINLDDYRDMPRDYDFRYISEKPFDPKVVFLKTLSEAKLAIEKAKRAGIPLTPEYLTTLIARDARAIEPALIDAQMAAWKYAGFNVTFIGRKPNSVTSYSWAIQEHKPFVSVFNTASHVSRPANIVVRGFKLAMRKQANGNIISLTTKEIKRVFQTMKKVADNPQKEIVKMAAAQKGNLKIDDNIETKAEDFNVLVGLTAAPSGSLFDLGERLKQHPNPRDLVSNLLEEYHYNNPLPLKGKTIVVEGAHTPSGQLTARTFERLGAKVIGLNLGIQEVTGEHKADPSNEENLRELKEAMQGHHADFGVAFDLDGDRGAMLVPALANGQYTTVIHTLAQDNIMGMLGPELNERWGYKQSGKLVASIIDVLSSRGTEDRLKGAGIKVYRSDTGYVFLKARKEVLEKQGYVVSGYAEKSGHGWLHVTGEVENPLAIAILFALIVQKAQEQHKNKDALTIYEETSVPYTQSPRFQPYFHPRFLADLSLNPANDTGWDANSQTPPPAKIVALGRDVVAEYLQKVLPKDRKFETVAGNLFVEKVVVVKGKDDGLRRFADIYFKDASGQFAGRAVVRASSNDPTFVMTYEVPLRQGTKLEAAKRRIAVAGIIDELLANRYAIFTAEQMKMAFPALGETEIDARLKKVNLRGRVENDILKAKAAESINEEDYAQVTDLKADDDLSDGWDAIADRAKQREGGIDFNTKNLNTTVSGEKVDIKFDKAMMAQFQAGDFSGVRPVIMSVTPLPSVLPLFGMAPGREHENILARVDM